MFIAIANAIGRNGGIRTDKLVPVNTVAPVISGTALIGNTLTSTTGTWTSDTGVTGYLYQWTRDGVNISGATNSTYTLVSADLHTTILCKVAATDTDGTSAYVNSNSLVVYDSDYKAVLDYATTQGYTLPSVSQRLKQSILLSSLKTAGVWSKLDTFANFATDGSSNFALIDWKRLTQYTAVNSPTFTTNQGFNGNGTSSYINTNYTPSTVGNNYSLNNCSFGYWAFSGLQTGGSRVNIGTRNNASSGLTYPVGVNENSLFINTNNVNNALLSASSGNLGLRHFNRANSSGSRYYNSTGLVGSNTNVSFDVSNFPFFIFAINTANTPSLYTTTRISIMFAGSSLATENTGLNNAFNTYITSL